jgi:predicted RNA-binding Zn-ribbon protein involved in translation (DUF1610 family)
MTQEEIKKNISEILDAWEARDLKGRREFYHDLRHVLEDTSIRRRYMKLPCEFRNGIHHALHPYEDNPDIRVLCPHCGKYSGMRATTSPASTASGYWAIVENDGQLFLDWDNDYEVDVSDLEFICDECGENMASWLGGLEELWAKQQEQSTNEKLGILGQ